MNRRVRTCLLGAALLSLAGVATAQQPEPADREAMYRAYLQIATRVHGGAIDVSWLPDGNGFLYSQRTADGFARFRVDPVANTLEPWLEPLPPESADDPAFASGAALPSPDGQWHLLEIGYDLGLRSARDGQLLPLTNDGTREVAWHAAGAKFGALRWAAQWSPSASHVLAYRDDYRGMDSIPLIDWLAPVENVEWRYYTRTGRPMSVPALYVIEVPSGVRVRIDAGDTRDHYLAPIGWTGGGEALFFRLSRDFRRLDVMAADPRTGASRIVVRETQPTFVKGISPDPRIIDLFHPLQDGRHFLWQSERDGWDHLYLYDFDGTLVRRLTSGRFPVHHIVGVDESERWVYFTASAEPEPYDIHLYRVGLDGRGFARLTDGEGEHDVRFSPSMQYFIDTHSSIDRPPTVELRSADGTLLRVLSRADTSQLAALGWQPPERFVVKAADGVTDLYGVLYKPTDFDPRRRYPVINNIYAGPQRTNVPRTFLGSRGRYAQALAQLGFVVFIVDARGTPGRGKAFQDVVHGNFGRHEIPDHVAVLRQLAATRPYVDLDRVGIFGASWGGYMTLRALVLEPEVFHAGVATYPVSDLHDHWNSPIEPYMGLLQENPDGYEYASNLRLAGKLRGRLLIVHGTSDVNAPFSSTMKMADALVQAGTLFDLVVFPGQTHTFTRDVVPYHQEAVRQHFQRHLQP